LTYAAGGFRDGTRVAASSPEMWTDIFLANRGAVLRSIDRFVGSCTRIREAIASDDRRALTRALEEARRIRRRLPAPRAPRPGARRGRRR
jgi:prephenate dehydrogenase